MMVLFLTQLHLLQDPKVLSLNLFLYFFLFSYYYLIIFFFYKETIEKSSVYSTQSDCSAELLTNYVTNSKLMELTSSLFFQKKVKSVEQLVFFFLFFLFKKFKIIRTQIYLNLVISLFIVVLGEKHLLFS